MVDKMHTLYYSCNIEKYNCVYEFSAEKNQQLIQERGVSFEEVVTAIETGAILDIVPHTNAIKYPNQALYLLEINGYIYVVPFIIQDAHHVFLKTIFPQRKLTKYYLGDKSS